MESDNLRQAIRFLKSGKKSEAQRLLRLVIKSNPCDETPWLWYVDTLSTNVERIQALEWCLEFNPDSAVARQGLTYFRKVEDKARTDQTKNEQPIERNVYKKLLMVQEVQSSKPEPYIEEYDIDEAPLTQEDQTTNEQPIECDADKATLAQYFKLVWQKNVESKFFCEDCGCPLAVCNRCGLYFCEDCQAARCNFCGEIGDTESELMWFDPEEDHLVITSRI